jgi:isoquinoline 1-oxidoreductase beta subunit
MNAITPVPASEDPRRVRLGRRGFLSVSAAMGGGLMLGVSVQPAQAAVTSATVNVFLVINSDNTMKFIVPGAEMGQGIAAGLPQALAEELPLDWTRLTVEPAPYGAQYASPWGQITGGSFSMRLWFQPMLKAGAAIREMMIAAAAQQWGVATTGLVCRNTNRVVNPATGLALTYGALAATAAGLAVPSSPTLRSATSAYTVVGTSAKRPDLPAKVNGSAIFGADVRVPNMVFAAIRHCPSFGGTVGSMPATPAGTLGLVNLGNAVAVVATNTWAAMQAAKNLQVGWSIPAASLNISSSNIASQARTLMGSTTPAIAETVGSVATAMAGATTTLNLTYSLPYLPHAAMETLSCTASVTATSCEIWAPTQAPDWVAGTAAAITGLPTSSVVVHTTMLGGGFGRKIEQDFIAQAVKVSKAIGKPVKLTWSREEDFGHDAYRPAALSRVIAGIDGAGNILGWTNRVVCPSVSEDHWPGSVANGLDMSALEGATGESGLVYAMASRQVEYVLQKAGVPVGWWRSVGHSYNCFAVESAIDELAAAARQDPLAYRQKLLASQPRHLAVLNAAATMANWTTPPAAGTARGIALSDGFGSIVALVLELTRVTSSTGVISYNVTKAFCAIDCGTAVNPNQIEAQMQGGVAMGLTSARWGRSTFENGKAAQLNFDNYRMLKLREMPLVQTRIVTFAGAPIGGVGETMVPPVAPALANAFFALTGTRKRTLPLGI